MSERIYYVNEPDGPLAESTRRKLAEHEIDLVSCPNPDTVEGETPIFLVDLPFIRSSEKEDVLRGASRRGLTVVALNGGSDEVKWGAIYAGASDIVSYTRTSDEILVALRRMFEIRDQQPKP